MPATATATAGAAKMVVVAGESFAGTRRAAAGSDTRRDVAAGVIADPRTTLHGRLTANLEARSERTTYESFD